jgi:uncharacterized protein (TIGR02217 family)
MTFHEIRFPTAVAFHSSAGPERKTEIVTLGSGFEERNAVWANSRRRFDAGYGVKSLDDLAAVIAFFEARNGRLYAFRFKDWSDFKSCTPGSVPLPLDQAIGTGDGHTTAFQLAKLYASGPASWTRVIKKPVAATVRIAIAGSERTSGFTVDVTSGLVSFTTAPAGGAAITAGFEFDTPARFDSDTLSVNLTNFRAGDIAHIPLVEVLV